ncbi:substrate-binding domain-containing protein [Klebsiella pneumoniae]|uniref:substrate-binding domain-containing protein n=1 Tax=Klebsiella pneumoniae TaxID=573 RepID=UPI001CA4C0BE|nr:substrate-binding domain-containing protein [Klebsiella pneumoniae]MBW5618947.1 LacI family DNA-binding transcriptional regulator [Klebsiella pneumoniae]
MITIRDVARQAGVSVATVSRVLNNSALVSPDTRDVVMKAVTQLGYRPNANAQALATQVSDTIGVVVMDVSDAFFGALMATRMLLNHGHQRIGYLSSNHGIEDDDMRREGWSKALQEQGIIAPDSWIGSGSPDMQGGEAAMVELLGRNLGLTAVFAYNDSMAAGALTTLKDNGIVVPQHLSLIGFDDIPISRYTDPQLTTVRYPVMSMAKLATELALLGAAGKLDREATHCFMPTLVRRHSVAQRQTVGPITN